jgi:hypothetical protein
MEKRLRFVLTAVLAGVLALSLGCGKKKEEGKEEKKEEKKEPDKKEPGGKGLKNLFPGSKVAFPAPVAKLNFKMTKAQVEKAVPALAKKWATIRPEGFKGVEIRVGYTIKPEMLRLVKARLPAAARDFLVKAWGKPVKAKVTSVGENEVWLNEADGMQAILRKRGGGDWDLVIWPFMPWKKQLGTDKIKFGFETKPLLGMKAEDVMKEYAKYAARKVSETRIDIRLPNYEYSQIRNTAILTIAKGVVTKMYVKFYYGAHPSVKAAMDAAIKAKFGKPVKVGKIYTTWSKKPSIRMGHSEVTKQYSFFVRPK